MVKFKAKNGTLFAYDPELKTEIVALMPDPEDSGAAPKAVKLDPSDLLEFAEMLFEKASYESVIRLRVSAGDVLLVRCQEDLSQSQMNNIEANIRDQILVPLGLQDSVPVVALGALDVEVVGKG